MEIKGANVVVIGGGTGSFVVLSGLKNYVQNLTALVNMADDGGSTGILRDELGVLPPGDVRQCLVALSDSPRARDLFNYRFSEGSFSGHSFGNLFLAALEKMTGSFAEGVDLADEILRVNGTVLPITLDNVVLSAKDGKNEYRGEFSIAHQKFTSKKPLKLKLELRADKTELEQYENGKEYIDQLKYPDATRQIAVKKGRVKANPAALAAIAAADLIVVAPGNLYGSLAPALLVPGIGNALKKSAAKKVYISNLVVKPGQTDGFRVDDYAREIERLAGTEFLDYVIYNTRRPTKEMLAKYAKTGENPVEFDGEKLKNQHYRAKGAELLAETIWQNPNKKDPIASARTLIRHDPDKVARAIMKIYFS
jgi:2-phospho-L-lactate transferase/gluconeogenesis factor (CofD/UPF0052 family)